MRIKESRNSNNTDFICVFNIKSYAKLDYGCLLITSALAARVVPY